MPTAEALAKVMELLTKHFQHEEVLMKASGFGSPGESFSPYCNHVKDHERILDLGYSELAKLSRELDPSKRAFADMTCSYIQEGGSS